LLVIDAAEAGLGEPFTKKLVVSRSHRNVARRLRHGLGAAFGEGLGDRDPIVEVFPAALPNAGPGGDALRLVSASVIIRCPACRMVAVTLPPAEESTFMVNRMAATGVVNAALADDEPLNEEKTVGADAPRVGFGKLPVTSSSV
jgi:hypothetical protein